MIRISRADVQDAAIASGALADVVRPIGRRRLSSEFVEETLGIALHLRFALEHRMREQAKRAPRASSGARPAMHDDTSFSSIPFYSLCKGIFLPLSGLSSERANPLFQIGCAPPPDAAARELLLATFFGRDLGLTLVQKLACVLGDPFCGRKGTFRRDSLLSLLLSVRLERRRPMLDRLALVGDIAALFAESRPTARIAPDLTAVEVLEALRFLPDVARNEKLDVLRSLLLRMGRLEAYFLAKLLLRKAGFGFEYQGALLARALAEHTHADVDDIAHAISLTDPFAVAEILARDGARGLRQIKLRPLVAVRPALASSTIDEVTRFPAWVERKYDGIRLMLHKSTDSVGHMLCGAYTRARGDWLELVPGLDITIRGLAVRTCIVDGELYGTVLDGQGMRPASVYEVYAALQGTPERAVSFRYAAFDLIYVDGVDLTGQPLRERRRRLDHLVRMSHPLPGRVPIALSDGQLAQNKDDVSRLYHHFRSGGYEGVISKDLDGTYKLAARDATWVKRKPELTLDLVLLQGVLAVTSKDRASMFGSYAIGARAADGSFTDVGDVAGVDRERELQIISEIMRDGLITGRRTERASASGVRPALELRPSIVVTVKFDGITKDLVTKRLALRDPKIAHLRSDKSAGEADTVKAIEELALRAFCERSMTSSRRACGLCATAVRRAGASPLPWLSRGRKLVPQVHRRGCGLTPRIVITTRTCTSMTTARACPAHAKDRAAILGPVRWSRVVFVPGEPHGPPTSYSSFRHSAHPRARTRGAPRPPLGALPRAPHRRADRGLGGARRHTPR